VRGLGLLVIAAFLAGCAAEPVQSSTRFAAASFERPALTEPLLQWRSLGASSLIVSPSATSTEITVPPGTLTVVVNQTLEAGAAFGLLVTAGGCVWDRPQSFVGIGQTIGADCGGLTSGAVSLSLATSAGALFARVEPMALVCERGPESWACPAPSPITTS